MSILVELAVGESPGQISVADADAIAAFGGDVGVTGLRLVDRNAERPTIDPSVVGSFLAGRHGDLGYVIDAPTTHNAPYNLARRVLSFDRATAGRVGVVLVPGNGDEVSDAAIPDVEATDPAERWAEYAEILTRLWESFPADALVGDQVSAVVAEADLIRPIDFDGRFYRVAGPLDGPSSAQGRPVLIAADPATVGWSRVVASADAVIVDRELIATADAELSGALDAVGRSRGAVALLARIDGRENASVVRRWASDLGVDGFVLAVDGGAEEILDVVRDLAPQLAGVAGGTLRAGLGVPVPSVVPA
ncbi:LLM class flavin-dependent oxidoreductase [Gordonia insulae]|uniref:Nitrilotriacetate monooxygenase component A n=1 Tax=Gordonia insulae TaxID=2420509 RepID=A0A3G8JUB3_9ACTN|nr:LLM class flavin-dependent oxidoreductase [Gordonia insulae]AZG47760.1 Nitrilotriacetate monooxygenase component A [Gordonia insulae]